MPPQRLALVFFVDALGWEIVRDTDLLAEVAPHRWRQRTVLGYSCAAQPTILTGRIPDEHGHWGMFYRSASSEMRALSAFRLLPRAVSDHRRFRRQVLRWHRGRSGFTGYYNLYRIPWRLFGSFDLIEKRDIYRPNAFVDPTARGPAARPDAPRVVASIFDELEDRNIPWRSWSWKHSLDQSFQELEASFSRDDRPAFALLYTPFIDGFLHEHVGDPDAVSGAVREVETRILHAVQAARAAYDEVRVVVFSDHGMARTTGSHDLMMVIEGLGLREGTDYEVFYDSTMARFWFESPRAERTVRDALAALPYGGVLSNEDLQREGVLFENRMFGELVFLMEPGRLIVPSYMGGRAPRGMHGFSPDHEDSYAVLMSSFDVNPAPTHIRDSHTVMREAAGLKP